MEHVPAHALPNEIRDARQHWSNESSPKPDLLADCRAAIAERCEWFVRPL